MKTILLYSFMLISLLGLAQTKETLTNKSIIELSKAGLSKEVIVSKIETTTCNFDLSTSGIIALKKANVDEVVIKAMIGKSNQKSEQTPTKMSPASKSMDGKKGNIPSVEIINHPYAWVKNKTTLLLEKGTAALKAKMKLLGYGGASTNYELEGESSPIRVSSNDSLTFIINTGGGTIPDLTLYKATKAKGKRSAKVAKIQGMVSKKGDKNSDAIVFTATQLKNGLYEIKPSIKLDKGEYIFCSKITVSAASLEVFAFGID